MVGSDFGLGGSGVAGFSLMMVRMAWWHHVVLEWAGGLCDVGLGEIFSKPKLLIQSKVHTTQPCLFSTLNVVHHCPRHVLASEVQPIRCDITAPPLVPLPPPPGRPLCHNNNVTSQHCPLCKSCHHHHCHNNCQWQEWLCDMASRCHPSCHPHATINTMVHCDTMSQRFCMVMSATPSLPKVSHLGSPFICIGVHACVKDDLQCWWYCSCQYVHRTLYW